MLSLRGINPGEAYLRALRGALGLSVRPLLLSGRRQTNRGIILRSKLLAVVLVVVCGAVAVVGVGVASGAAKTTVTIVYNGDGFQGKVKSPKAKCVRNRTVNVYKQTGSEQSPSTDQKLYTDMSDSGGSWDTGTSGQAHGKFYARAKRKTGCRPGRSVTIKATR
jgi:hypothetical protein